VAEAVTRPEVVGAIAIHPNDAARMITGRGREIAPGHPGGAGETGAPAPRDGGPRIPGCPACDADADGLGRPRARDGARPAAEPRAHTHLVADGGADGIVHTETASDAACLTGPRAGADAYRDAIAEIEALARSSGKVRAIGETGLDYFRTGPEGRPAQLAAFRDHIALAKELGLALQIHDRDAHADVIKTLREQGAPDRTVFHCFSGDREMAAVAAKNGWYCSFAGTVTFKGSDELRLAAALLPKELILVETDSPYLTPDPFRGRPNAPYMVARTMEILASAMAVPLVQACQQIQANTTAVYGDW
jgi:TatD family hydrolase